MRPRSWSLLLLAVLLLSACETRRYWREIDSPPLTFEEVWVTVLDKAAVNGFTAQTTGDMATDRGLKVFHSKWITRVKGFGPSVRMRMHAEFLPAPAEPKGWRIRFHVERQRVTDMAHVLEPRESDWKSDGQATDAEDRLSAMIRMQLGMDMQQRDAEQGTKPR